MRPTKSFSSLNRRSKLSQPLWREEMVRALRSITKSETHKINLRLGKGEKRGDKLVCARCTEENNGKVIWKEGVGERIYIHLCYLGDAQHLRLVGDNFEEWAVLLLRRAIEGHFSTWRPKRRATCVSQQRDPCSILSARTQSKREVCARFDFS